MKYKKKEHTTKTKAKIQDIGKHNSISYLVGVYISIYIIFFTVYRELVLAIIKCSKIIWIEQWNFSVP